MTTRGFVHGLALSLAALLSACGGSTNSVDASSTRLAVATEPQTSPVEPYTPELTKAGVQDLHAYTLGRNSPAPSAQLVLGSASADVAKVSTSSERSLNDVPQIGVGRQVTELRSASDFSQRLSWTPTDSGGQITAIRFVATGAAGARLLLDVAAIPAQAQLRFYGQGATTATQVSGAEVQDSISANAIETPGSTASRTYAAPYVEGEEVNLEIELPAGVPTRQLQINVPRISHLFQSPTAAKLVLKINNSGSCEIDVGCNADWASTSNSTARMLFSDVSTGSSYLCTGTLLNDRANSQTPYFLSANHCIATQAVASTLQTFWFYRASACGSGVLSGLSKTVSGGATLLYTSISNDTTLLKLNSSPPAGVTYAGWSPSLPAVSTAIGSVHNPSGDLQKISVGQVAGYSACTRAAGSTSISCGSSTAANSTHITVGWTSGVTEGGSSGSGLFQTSNKYLVGVLTGGASYCSNPKGTDVYGRFDLAYQAGIFQWLDNASAASRSPVYRFYNRISDSHFYTITQSERDALLAANPAGLSYDGIRFYAYSTSLASVEPVYRFYNASRNTYFYTISQTERDLLIQLNPSYSYQGVGWYANSASNGVNTALYRFYNASAGAHFYTADTVERDLVIQLLPRFRYEDTGYYVWNAP